MENFDSYVPIFDKWPSTEALGDDIGVDAAHIRTLKSRDSIPPKYWTKIEDGAKKRGIKDVTIKILAQIAAAKNGDWAAVYFIMR